MATSAGYGVEDGQRESSRGSDLLLAAIQAGLSGEAGRMQQLLRRSLRDLPHSVREDEGLVRALAEAATHGTPPVEGSRRDRLRDLATWASPTRTGEFLLSDDSALSEVLPLRGDASPRGSGNGAERPEPAHFGSDIDQDDLPSALTVDLGEPIEPVLSSSVREVLDNVVAEHHSPMLAVMDIDPTAKVMLVGPPGTGKTMCARWIASQVQRPLLVLDLASVMSHELGRSAKNLSVALNYAARVSAVLFIDEFDAIASARADSSDVGEVRRLVNVLLMALDNWPSGGLLIAATNHPELLDRAIERRFDEIVALDKPFLSERAQLWSARLPTFSSGYCEVLASLSDGFTGAEIDRVAARALRRAGLRGEQPTLGQVLDALSAQPGGGVKAVRENRTSVIRLLAAHTTMGQREIGRLLGVSHTTVGKALDTRNEMSD